MTSSGHDPEYKHSADKIIVEKLPRPLRTALNADFVWKPMSNQCIAVTNPADNKTQLISFTQHEKHEAHVIVLILENIANLPQAATYLQRLEGDYLGTYAGGYISLWDIKFSSQNKIERMQSFKIPAGSTVDKNICLFHGKQFIYYDSKKHSLNFFAFEKNELTSIPFDKERKVLKIAASNDEIAVEVIDTVSELSFHAMVFLGPHTEEISLRNLRIDGEWSFLPNCFESPDKQFFVLSGAKPRHLSQQQLIIYRKSPDNQIDLIARVDHILKPDTVSWLPDNTLVFYEKHALSLFNTEDLTIRPLYPIPEGDASNRPRHVTTKPDGQLIFTVGNKLVTIIPETINKAQEFAHDEVDSTMTAALLNPSTGQYNAKDLVNLIKEYAPPSEYFSLFKPAFQVPSNLPMILTFEMKKQYQYYNDKVSALHHDEKAEQKFEKFHVYHDNLLALKAIAKLIQEHPEKTLAECVESFKDNVGKEIYPKLRKGVRDLLNNIAATKKSLSISASTSSGTDEEKERPNPSNKI